MQEKRMLSSAIQQVPKHWKLLSVEIWSVKNLLRE